MINFVKTRNDVSHLCTGRVVSSKIFTIPKNKIGNFYNKNMAMDENHQFNILTKTMKELNENFEIFLHQHLYSFQKIVIHHHIKFKKKTYN